MLPILYTLAFLIPTLAGLSAYLVKRNNQLKYELSKQSNENVPRETTEKPSFGDLPVSERTKILNDYKKMNFNFSADLLDNYKIMEFNTRQQFYDFINKDITGGN